VKMKPEIPTVTGDLEMDVARWREYYTDHSVWLRGNPTQAKQAPRAEQVDGTTEPGTASPVEIAKAISPDSGWMPIGAEDEWTALVLARRSGDGAAIQSATVDMMACLVKLQGKRTGKQGGRPPKWLLPSEYRMGLWRRLQKHSPGMSPIVTVQTLRKLVRAECAGSDYGAQLENRESELYRNNKKFLDSIRRTAPEVD
jgi:hypothetical protein